MRWFSDLVSNICHAIGRAFAVLLTVEGLRAWALVLIGGSAISGTALAVWALWLLRGQPTMIFWLAMVSHLTVILSLLGLLAVLGVKRSVEVDGPGGIKLKVADHASVAQASVVAAAMNAKEGE